MKLVQMKLFCIEYAGNIGPRQVLIEAENYAEAERLFKEKCETKFHIFSITEHRIPTFKKVTKITTVEL